MLGLFFTILRVRCELIISRMKPQETRASGSGTRRAKSRRWWNCACTTFDKIMHRQWTSTIVESSSKIPRIRRVMTRPQPTSRTKLWCTVRFRHTTGLSTTYVGPIASLSINIVADMLHVSRHFGYIKSPYLRSRGKCLRERGTNAWRHS